MGELHCRSRQSTAYTKKTRRNGVYIEQVRGAEGEQELRKACTETIIADSTNTKKTEKEKRDVGEQELPMGELHCQSRQSTTYTKKTRRSGVYIEQVRGAKGEQEPRKASTKTIVADSIEIKRSDAYNKKTRRAEREQEPLGRESNAANKESTAHRERREEGEQEPPPREASTATELEEEEQELNSKEPSPKGPRGRGKQGPGPNYSAAERETH